MSTMWPPDIVKICRMPSCLSILATIWPPEIISAAGVATEPTAVSTAVPISTSCVVQSSGKFREECRRQLGYHGAAVTRGRLSGQCVEHILLGQRNSPYVQGHQRREQREGGAAEEGVVPSAGLFEQARGDAATDQRRHAFGGIQKAVIEGRVLVTVQIGQHSGE